MYPRSERDATLNCLGKEGDIQTEVDGLESFYCSTRQFFDWTIRLTQFNGCYFSFLTILQHVFFTSILIITLRGLLQDWIGLRAVFFLTVTGS